MTNELNTERKISVISLAPKDVRLREAAGNVFRIIAPLGTTVERLEE